MDGKHLQSSPAAGMMRDETSVKGHMPGPGIQSHPQDHTADIPAHAQAAWLMVRSCCFGEAHGFFHSARLAACGNHTTSHHILQGPGALQVCLLAGSGTEQVVRGWTLTFCVERLGHPPSPEDRSCLCQLILNSLTQGRTKSTL